MAEGINEISGAGTGDAGSPEGAKVDTGASNWRDNLSEEYKTHKSLESYKDLNSLAKSHIEAQSYIGGSVKVPGAEATEEDWNKFFDKTGRPKTQDEYTSDIKLPDGMTYNDDSLKEFKDLAHKYGLSNKQFKAIKEHYDNKAIEFFNAKAGDVTKKETDFDTRANARYGADVKKVLTNAKELITLYGNSEDKEILSKLDNDALLGFAGILTNIRKKYISEDSGSIRNTGAPAQSQADITTKMNEITSWQLKNNNNKLSTEFKQKTAELTKLRRIMGIV